MSHVENGPMTQIANQRAILMSNAFVGHISGHDDASLYYPDTETIGDLLTLPACDVVAMSRAFARLTGRELDAAIASELKGPKRRDCLRLLRDAEAADWRLHVPGLPIEVATLHSLWNDPSGLQGQAVDGRIEYEIDQLLRIRKLERHVAWDMVSQHEITNNNSVTPYIDGPAAFKRFFRVLSRANSTIHLSYYAIEIGEATTQLRQLLIKKAAQGVKVRIMLDGIGSVQWPWSKARAFIDELASHPNIEVIRNEMFVQHPDHRKMAVIDGQTAFVGGMNINDETYKGVGWHDLLVELRGDSVKQVQIDFLRTWLARGGTLDPQASRKSVIERYFPKAEHTGKARVKIAQHIVGENDEIARTYLQLIEQARFSVYIATPYFTDPEIRAALIAAVARGVDVHLMLPGRPDHEATRRAARDVYHEMLAAGPKMHMYEYDGFNHLKLMIVDDRYVSVGSSNFDSVSLHRAHEINANVDDVAVAQMWKSAVFAADLSRSLVIARDLTAPIQWGAWLVSCIDAWHNRAWRYFFDHFV